MSGLFNKQRVQKAQPVLREEVDVGAKERARLRRLRTARSSTILAGANPELQVANTATKRLLGGT